ncbi:MAG: phosphate ABC transporter substrate-binding protein [bacterium]
MKTIINRLLRPASFILVFVLIAGCQRGAKTRLIVAGSTSVQPFADLLAELYMNNHPGVEINVQGGGSTAGIHAVQNHICNIGMSSRPLSKEEQHLTQWTIALDGIVVIVHKQNPVRDLTLEELRAIFTGKIRNWQELGRENKKITLIIREEGSGTRGCFEEMVMQGAPFARDALVQDSNGAVREIVAGDLSAIGFISFGLVDERVKPLSINGIVPTESTIASRTYPIARKFLFLTNGEPGVLARSFIEFVLSPQGQKALVDEGLIKAIP